MIHFIYANDLAKFPTLRSGMFQDRRVQFKERQGWDVSVNEFGEEIDQYDQLNPLYVIAELDGQHHGSMRFLPTVGRTLVNEHFTQLNDGLEIRNPLIWECTRFCISPFANRAGNVAAMLMLAGAELGLRFGLRQSVGVFDARMTRIYKRIGWAPEVLGTEILGSEETSVGLWQFSEAIKLQLCTKYRISPRTVEDWFDASFPASEIAEKAVRIA